MEEGRGCEKKFKFVARVGWILRTGEEHYEDIYLNCWTLIYLFASLFSNKNDIFNAVMIEIFIKMDLWRNAKNIIMKNKKTDGEREKKKNVRWIFAKANYQIFGTVIQWTTYRKCRVRSWAVSYTIDSGCTLPRTPLLPWIPINHKFLTSLEKKYDYPNVLLWPIFA